VCDASDAGAVHGAHKVKNYQQSEIPYWTQMETAAVRVKKERERQREGGGIGGTICVMAGLLCGGLTEAKSMERHYSRVVNNNRKAKGRVTIHTRYK